MEISKISHVFLTPLSGAEPLVKTVETDETPANRGSVEFDTRLSDHFDRFDRRLRPKERGRKIMRVFYSWSPSALHFSTELAVRHA